MRTTFIIFAMATPEKATAEIVRELKQGRERQENFRLLFQRYYARLYRFFQIRRMPAADCQDLTQQVFISVYRGLGGLRQEEQFEGWLRTIAKNVYMHEVEYRQADKRAAPHVPLDEVERAEDAHRATPPVIDPGPSALETLLEREKREKLRAVLQELPMQMRRCLQLRVAEELSHQEIAVVMRLSVNTVKAHLYQAREALRKRIGKDFLIE